MQLKLLSNQAYNNTSTLKTSKGKISPKKKAELQAKQNQQQFFASASGRKANLVVSTGEQ